MMQENESAGIQYDADPKIVETRKPYNKPDVVHDLELEVRTGSPIGTDPFDILDKP